MIDWFFHTLFGPRKIKTDFKALANIWDIPKAEAELKRILKIAGKYGPTDHIKRVFATWWFDGNGAYRVGFKEDTDDLTCVLMLNAKSTEFFAKWPRARQFDRFMWLLEAFFDSLEMRRCFESGHSVDVRFTSSPSPEVTIGSIISASRFAYQTNRRVDRALADNFTDRRRRPLTLAFLYQEDSDPPLLNALVEELDYLPKLVNSEIERVISGVNRDEIDVWLKCSGAVGSVVMKLAGLAAAFDGTSDWQWQQSRLYDNKAFSKVFSDTWPLLHADWRSESFIDKPTDVDPNEELTGSLKGLFSKLGIDILDKPRGASILQFRNMAGNAA